MLRSIRWQRQCLFPGACLAGLPFLLMLAHEQERVSWDDHQATTYIEAPEFSCRDLPGANETVVALRTGSTEMADKLPVHFSTTLRCYPNHLIFSDHEEIYQNKSIVDALESVSADLLEDHPDFELHRRLRRSGRDVLGSSELSGADNEAVKWTGKVDNPGWKLDKWKFLPMITRTFHEYPDMKWYIFVEADSFIFWRSTLQYPSLLDHTKPHYSGSAMYIGDDLFAHGGL